MAKIKAIRVIKMTEVGGTILDIFENKLGYTKGGKFTKETQDLFDCAIDGLKDENYVFLDAIMED